MYTIPFHATSWKDIPETTHAGETGVAYWRTQTYGNLRVRMVRYSENYKADIGVPWGTSCCVWKENWTPNFVTVAPCD
jgi:hypothetical protein